MSSNDLRLVSSVYEISTKKKNANDHKRKWDEKVENFADNLEVSATGLRKLGLDKVSLATQIHMNFNKKQKKTPCERLGCSGKTQKNCGICSNHACVYKGCGEVQKDSGFCSKHLSVYRYLKP
jgi:hypothetical protein